MKNKLVKSLLSAMLASVACADAALSNGKTFIAHRDELANAGMEWTNNNHLLCKQTNCTKTECDAQDKNGRAMRGGKSQNCDKKKCNKLGACVTATPFYSQSTNNKDLAYLFGMGTTESITVTKGSPVVTATGAADATAMSTTLYNANIQLSPNSDYVSLAASAGTANEGDYVDPAANRVPMYGVVNLSPIRQVYGAYLGWNQSLDALLNGLSFNVRAPVVQVRTSMRSTLASSTASSIPAEDGPSGNTLKDYFNGSLSIARAGSNLHVIQYAMTKDLIDNTYATATGLADLELAANYAFRCTRMKSVTWSLGASVQIPTANKPTMTRLFEPLYGARGHVGAGAQGSMHTDIYKKDAVRIGFDLLVNWKYFFKNTELRTMGVYDTVLATMLPASQYRLVMQNGITGVQPAANVLTVNHDVTPRNQVDAVAGLSAEYKNFAFNLGYNFYWHQTDVVTTKSGAWTSDKYAFAHPHYSMNTAAPATVNSGDEVYVIGGGTLTGYNSGVIRQNGGYIGDHSGVHIAVDNGTFADASAAVTKHSYAIGSNGDAGNTIRIMNTDNDGYLSQASLAPAAFTSAGGPIQAAGSTSSALPKLLAATTTGVNAADTGTLTVRYNTSSTAGVTCNQMTHSVVGGVSYKFNGNFPMVIGVGGQGEFQASSRNSALEGYKVWAKFGISF